MGDKAVKLSNISRNSSFSKLEQRLGKYQARKNDVIIQNQVKSSVTKSSWEEYQAERHNYLESKFSALKKLRERQKHERENLYLVQKNHRAKIFSENWKGRGAELNQIRSIFSFASQKERLTLQERQKEEMQELRSHFLKRFPSFRDWLSESES